MSGCTTSWIYRCLIFIIFSHSVFADTNIIRNPGFENVAKRGCAQIDYEYMNDDMQYWDGSSSDYFYDCDPNDRNHKLNDIPYNIRGHQFPRPHDPNGPDPTNEVYTSVASGWYHGNDKYLDLPNDTKFFSEYIHQKLTRPLSAGILYEIGFSYALGERTDAINTQLGMLLSPKDYKVRDYIHLQNYINDTPQLAVDTETTLIDPISGKIDFDSWLDAKMPYTAAGGEAHIYLGSFNRDKVIPLKDPMPAAYNTCFGTYYYFDDAVVSCVQFPKSKVLGYIRKQNNFFIYCDIKNLIVDHTGSKNVVDIIWEAVEVDVQGNPVKDPFTYSTKEMLYGQGPTLTTFRLGDLLHAAGGSGKHLKLKVKTTCHEEWEEKEYFVYSTPIWDFDLTPKSECDDPVPVVFRNFEYDPYGLLSGFKLDIKELSTAKTEVLQETWPQGVAQNISNLRVVPKTMDLEVPGKYELGLTYQCHGTFKQTKKTFEIAPFELRMNVNGHIRLEKKIHLFCDLSDLVVDHEGSVNIFDETWTATEVDASGSEVPHGFKHITKTMKVGPGSGNYSYGQELLKAGGSGKYLKITIKTFCNGALKEVSKFVYSPPWGFDLEPQLFCGASIPLTHTSGNDIYDLFDGYRWELTQNSTQQNELFIDSRTGDPVSIPDMKTYIHQIDLKQNGIYDVSLGRSCGGKWLFKQKSFQIKSIPLDWSVTPLVPEKVDAYFNLNKPSQTKSVKWFIHNPVDGDKTVRDVTNGAYHWSKRGTYPIDLELVMENGCVVRETKDVRVVLDRLYVPTGFTPEGSGPEANERFKPEGTDMMVTKFEIFNRYGEKVYEESPNEVHLLKGWDGTYRGQPSAIGAYMWVVSFHDNYYGLKDQNRGGTVTLIR